MSSQRELNDHPSYPTYTLEDLAIGFEDFSQLEQEVDEHSHDLDGIVGVDPATNPAADAFSWAEDLERILNAPSLDFYFTEAQNLDENTPSEVIMDYDGVPRSHELTSATNGEIDAHKVSFLRQYGHDGADSIITEGLMPDHSSFRLERTKAQLIIPATALNGTHPMIPTSQSIRL